MTFDSHQLETALAAVWLLSGWVNVYLGKPDVAIERATRAIHLSPLHPSAFPAHSIIGSGHFNAGRYDEAASWVEKGLRQSNSAVAARNAAMSYALAGRTDKAQKASARLRQIDPRPQVSYIRQLPFRRPEDFERCEEALRKAELPK